MRCGHSMPFGAEFGTDGGVRFRLWAPKAHHVDVCLQNFSSGNSEQEHFSLEKLGDGWFELATNTAAAGTRYQFEIDGGVKVPDPASRFQPLDVHGPSEVVDPRAFDWNERERQWCGRR